MLIYSVIPISFGFIFDIYLYVMIGRGLATLYGTLAHRFC